MKWKSGEGGMWESVERGGGKRGVGRFFGEGYLNMSSSASSAQITEILMRNWITLRFTYSRIGLSLFSILEGMKIKVAQKKMRDGFARHLNVMRRWMTEGKLRWFSGLIWEGAGRRRNQSDADAYMKKESNYFYLKK